MINSFVNIIAVLMFSGTTQDAAVLHVIQRKKKKTKASADAMDLSIKEHSKG